MISRSICEKVLLDTHTFLWWVDDSPKLSRKAKEIIEDIDNSCWEMAIKSSIGKLELSIPVKESIPRQVAANDFSMLSISFRIVILVETMLFIIGTLLIGCW